VTEYYHLFESELYLFTFYCWSKPSRNETVDRSWLSIQAKTCTTIPSRFILFSVDHDSCDCSCPLNNLACAIHSTLSLAIKDTAKVIHISTPASSHTSKGVRTMRLSCNHLNRNAVLPARSWRVAQAYLNCQTRARTLQGPIPDPLLVSFDGYQRLGRVVSVTLNSVLISRHLASISRGLL
jgi:hypothetical protein